MDSLYENLHNEGVDSVKIIAIGQGQYSDHNLNWTEGNSIPIVLDPSPNDLWSSWGASQWELFFLDSNGSYITDFDITDYTTVADDDTSIVFEYNKVYNQIINLLPE